MNIQMIGIDYNIATIDERSTFSFTKPKCIRAMQTFCAIPGIKGCIIISTCNRLEVWVSVEDGASVSLQHILCDIKKVDFETYQRVFVQRCEQEAIIHLFYVAAGLKSQILGEDQIITQVKEALAIARENDCTDNILEVLFKSAITAGKRVKTEVVISKENSSLAMEVIAQLRQMNYPIEGKTCMVIGNGRMGRLVATVFAQQKAEVMVTLRKYKYQEFSPIEGATIIPYDDRQNYFSACDIILSATSCPHQTITYDLVKGANRELLLFDLAVPRDIDPRCKMLPNVTLYDVDDFKTNVQQINQEALYKAKEIIKEEIDKFHDWQTGAVFVPVIQTLKQKIAVDVTERAKHHMKLLELGAENTEEIGACVTTATQSVCNKLLFGLKKVLSVEEFEKCLKGIEQLYE